MAKSLEQSRNKFEKMTQSIRDENEIYKNPVVVQVTEHLLLILAGPNVKKNEKKNVNSDDDDDDVVVSDNNEPFVVGPLLQRLDAEAANGRKHGATFWNKKTEQKEPRNTFAVSVIDFLMENDINMNDVIIPNKMNIYQLVVSEFFQKKVISDVGSNLKMTQERFANEAAVNDLNCSWWQGYYVRYWPNGNKFKNHKYVDDLAVELYVQTKDSSSTTKTVPQKVPTIQDFAEPLGSPKKKPTAANAPPKAAADVKKTD
jgi:hypothetical protein